MKKSFLFQTFLWCIVLGLAFATFAQSSLIQFGQANKSGKSFVQAPMAPITFIDQVQNGVNGLFADSDCQLCGTLQQTVAENFTTSVGSPSVGIQELIIWGGYYPEDIPNTTDNFTIILHSDNAGSPGAVVDSRTGLQAASRVQTGVILFGTHEYMFTFDFSADPIIIPSSGTYWIELFNNSNPSGNFYWETGNLDGTHGIAGSGWYTTTPGTSWNLDPATDLSLKLNGDDNLIPCSVGVPVNPSPANGAVDVDINANLSWANGAGTTNVEVIFNGTSVYSGSPITTWDPGTLNFATNYTWKIICSDGTCSTYGPTWSFTTIQDPNLVSVTVDIYPQNLDYWTGTCDAATKTQVSLVNTNVTAAYEVGWMTFDVTPILNVPSTAIESITFNGYLYANSWPYWSITPMGTVNPVTATASDIYSQVSNSYAQGTAYSYNQESGTIGTGYIQRSLTDGGATANMLSSLGQGWFAIGIADFDFSTSYYVDFQGWNEANKPFLTVTYTYSVPVELTSFTASANFGVVDLQWITATETNNQGFEVQRSSGSDFETIAFVNGYGTTTETQAYSYSDKSVEVGTYSYRLKQVDFDGTFDYSNVVEVNVPAPSTFALEQNYPNPFNPSTKINFQLKVDSKVSLKVFDILGQEVATLVNTNLVAGAHNVNFDASALNSGVYLYRIEATGIDGSNFVDVKKMILTK
jgi:hypothetical protein